MDDTIGPAAPSSLAIVGTFVPRHCGIATFTSDLHAALRTRYPWLRSSVVAVDDTAEGYDYPPAVELRLAQHDRDSYSTVADELNARRVDAVLVQHEYGIFGGESGRHLLPMLRALRMPIVTTLHTVLAAPSADQHAVLCALAALSTRVVVMSRYGKELLRRVYGVSAARIDVVPHGIADVPFTDPGQHKAALGLAGRDVLLTFGLLSPNKGIEQVVRALPTLLAQRPDVTYVVAGETHPHVQRGPDGESYRAFLHAEIQRYGVADHVVFYDRFLDTADLLELLLATDVYITPYRSREQIVSGTLAAALGSGRAVVSTPYSYAAELLGEGRGRLVEPDDPVALAREVGDLLDDPDELHATRRRAWVHGRDMVWAEVAARYAASLARALATHRTSTPFGIAS